jgi:hypothetical protein
MKSFSSYSPFKSRLEAGWFPPNAALERLLNGCKYAVSGVLLYLNDFTTFVVTALGTDAMLHAWFLTIGTYCGLRCAQRIMRAAFAAACF